MRATEGDQLVQHGRIVGQHDKVGEITQVLGENGTPVPGPLPGRTRGTDGSRTRLHGPPPLRAHSLNQRRDAAVP